ncbi:MAG: DEAD/DEAH box helicase family protein, partial [Methanobacteriaceae archaeon]|nr:DEAD/DEAH box helicase family protein [Methanobacteriaceae archaeon]
IFSQWLFKYQEFQFIPHSENGLKFFKGLLKTLEEKEIDEFIDFHNIEKERGLLEKRKENNEIKEADIDTISAFLNDIFTYLSKRFGEDYWFKQAKKTYSGNNIAELNLWNHQTEAIHNWLENGSRGLLEMATGTGKTLTALGCLKEKIIHENKLLVVIACPFNHLVSQWDRELEKIGIFSHKMIADSTNPKWKKQLKNALIDIKIGTYNYIIVLTTHKTMSSSKFIDLINDTSNKDNETLLIVDEVHGIGAPEMRKGLISRYDYRLGLSATPSRWMDEYGTGEIMGFFQETVFKFDLQKAINTINSSTGESFLCPYEYKPYLVDLNYEEISSYNELTKKIAQAYSKGNSLPELISNRHEIVDNASNKYGSLKNILDNIPNIQHTLVYCSPRQIESVQKILNEKAIIQHKFTMKEGVNKRKEYVGLSQREYLLKNFDEGVYQALVAIKCLDEGVDVPSAKIAIMMSSTRNPIQYVQRRGRILRRAPGKDKAIIYDLIVIPQPNLEDYEYKKVERELIQKEIDRYREFASAAINHKDCLNVINELKKKLGVDE